MAQTCRLHVSSVVSFVTHHFHCLLQVSHSHQSSSMASTGSHSGDNTSSGGCTTPISNGTNSDSDLNEDGHASDEFHRCSACKQPYCDPRVLNCFHSFCAYCLEGMVVTKDEMKCVQCRKCSALTQCPTGSLHDDIKINFGLRRYIETLTFDRDDRVVCRSCRQDTIAIARCFDCAIFMCEQCAPMHKQLTIYAGHTIGDLSSPVTRQTDQQPCGKHPDLWATVYCHDCSEPFCEACRLQHQSCKKTAISDSSYTELITNVTIEQTQSLKQADYYYRGMTQLDSSLRSAMEDLTKAKEEYEQRLNEHFMMLQQQIKQLANDTRAAASAQYQAYSTYCSELEKINQFMKVQSKLALAWDNMQTRPFIENILQVITNSKPDSRQINFSFEFVSGNPNAVPTIGYVYQYQNPFQADQLVVANQQQPIARPTSVNRSSTSQNDAQANSSNLCNSYNSQDLSNGYRQSSGNQNQAFRTSGLSPAHGFNQANGSNGYDMGSVHSNGFNHFPVQTPSYQTQTPSYQAMQTPNYQAQTPSYQAHTTNYQRSTPSPVAMPSYPAHASSYPRSTPSPVMTPSYLAQTPSYQAQTPNYQRSTPSPVTPSSQTQTSTYQAQTSNYQRSTPSPMTSSQPNSASLVDEAVFNFNNLSLNQANGTNANHTLQYANYSRASNQIQPYQAWSNGVDQQSDSSTIIDVFSMSNNPMFEAPTTPRNSHSRSYPPIKRTRMQYMAKFGEYGNAVGQFTEPSGVTIDGRNRLVVADTNNHRVQIFDVFGRFQSQFGPAVNSKLTYPNRIAVSKKTGKVVITERAPSHRVQTYTLQGHHLDTFGEDILQHPRGVTIDKDDNIIIVECKVMLVTIFNMKGDVLSKFGCSEHLQFPNSVAVNNEGEIFISDNRAHNVKVFNYVGRLLRTIGREGLTNYPIAVAINQRGEVVVADNHNNFNLTVFTQQGELVAGYESKTKHAQCFDLALTDDGVAILTSKDFKVYCYPYQDDCPYLQNHRRY